MDAPEANAPPPPDGPARLTRTDLRLRNRAARERWAVPPELLVETLYQVQAILADPESSTRDVIAAGRLLATLTRTDQLDDRLDLDRARAEPPAEPDARAALLGEALRIIREKQPS